MISQKHVDSIKKNFNGRFCGDARHRFKEGDIGFLLELTPENGVSRLELRDSPARTAYTLNDVLYGIIDGRTCVEALGTAKVTKVAKNGRGEVETLWGQDLEDSLMELGYPEISRDVYDDGNG